MPASGSKPPIERLRIRNYRVLRDVTFDRLTRLTVLFGPNGSGKSTVFDVFAFLNEAFTTNLRRAWDGRNRIREIRSRGSDGPVGPIRGLLLWRIVTVTIVARSRISWSRLPLRLACVRREQVICRWMFSIELLSRNWKLGSSVMFPRRELHTSACRPALASKSNTVIRMLSPAERGKLWNEFWLVVVTMRRACPSCLRPTKLLRIWTSSPIAPRVFRSFATAFVVW